MEQTGAQIRDWTIHLPYSHSLGWSRMVLATESGPGFMAPVCHEFCIRQWYRA